MNEEKLPKWYGKRKILADIKNQGEDATSLQNLMLTLNELKNTYANLNTLTIKDYFTDEENLSPTDIIEIDSIIQGALLKLDKYSIRKSKSSKSK